MMKFMLKCQCLTGKQTAWLLCEQLGVVQGFQPGVVQGFQPGRLVKSQ